MTVALQNARATCTAWLPVKTVSEANTRGHWSARARRAKTQRLAARVLCPRAPLPATVLLTRHSAGTLDDDNLRGALKAVRDGIADAFGVPDNDPRLRFEYAQAKCARDAFGVHVLVTWE